MIMYEYYLQLLNLTLSRKTIHDDSTPCFFTYVTYIEAFKYLMFYYKWKILNCLVQNQYYINNFSVASKNLLSILIYPRGKFHAHTYVYSCWAMLQYTFILHLPTSTLHAMYRYLCLVIGISFFVQTNLSILTNCFTIGYLNRSWNEEQV
jgi:hypothetical protein